MIELLGGIVIGGIAGATLKDKLAGGTPNTQNSKAEVSALYAENEKFSRRNKELERQVEDLLSELNKVRKNAKDLDDEHDDLEDELDNAKKELKSIRLQNEELARKVKEYKTACEAQESEISLLKERIG